MHSRNKPVDLLIIGHPLAAKENRLPFAFPNLNTHLIIPNYWPSKTLGKEYFPNPKNNPENWHFLPVKFAGNNTFFIWENVYQLLRELRPRFIYSWSEPWCFSTLQICFIALKIKAGFAFYSAGQPDWSTCVGQSCTRVRA